MAKKRMEMEIEERGNAQTAANIIFIGRRQVKDGTGTPLTVKAEPPRTIIDGRFKAEMPDAAAQHKGFYHTDAGRIIRAFPTLYKRFQAKKGE